MPNNYEIDLDVTGGSGSVTLQAQDSGSGDIGLETSEGSVNYARQAEAWAVGKKNGVDVASTDETYHNNSKYYSELSQEYAGAAAGFVVNTGAISSLPKTISDSRIDASCIVENDYVFSDMDLGWVTAEGQLILYGTLRTGETKPSQQLYLRKIPGLAADAPAVSLRLATSSSQGGNYLVPEARNLLPGIQYSFSLYKVVANDDDVYVYGVGVVASYPTRAFWFQEVDRGLEDGESYYVTLKKTTDPTTVLATSNTVEFEGGANVPAPSLSMASPLSAPLGLGLSPQLGPNSVNTADDPEDPEEDPLEEEPEEEPVEETEDPEEPEEAVDQETEKTISEET